MMHTYWDHHASAVVPENICLRKSYVKKCVNHLFWSNALCVAWLCCSAVNIARYFLFNKISPI